MTNFVKENFDFDGMYLNYGGKFIARFKYCRGERSSFQSFLIKNFTVEEYFQQSDAGVAPQNILESKGYISMNVKKVLKAAGYEVSIAGKQKYLNDQVTRILNKN